MVVIRKGIKLYSGRVDEMSVSNGFIDLKVDRDEIRFTEVLEKHPAIQKVHKEQETFIAILNKDFSASEMNAYLFENGFSVSHLVKRKPSLEKQFLDLTNNSSTQ